MKRKGFYKGVHGEKSGYYIKDKKFVGAGRFYADDGSDFHSPADLIVFKKGWLSVLAKKTKTKMSNCWYRCFNYYHNLKIGQIYIAIAKPGASSTKIGDICVITQLKENGNTCIRFNGKKDGGYHAVLDKRFYKRLV